MINVDLFDTPIRSGKIRNGVYYHQYRNGVINIMGEKYLYYSIKEAVSRWRKKKPIKINNHG
jgi:hypothetical protein